MSFTEDLLKLWDDLLGFGSS